MSENDFECFAKTGVNAPGTMFPDSTNFDFPEADFPLLNGKPSSEHFLVADEPGCPGDRVTSETQVR